MIQIVSSDFPFIGRRRIGIGGAGDCMVIHNSRPYLIRRTPLSYSVQRRPCGSSLLIDAMAGETAVFGNDALRIVDIGGTLRRGSICPRRGRGRLFRLGLIGFLYEVGAQVEDDV